MPTYTTIKEVLDELRRGGNTIVYQEPLEPGKVTPSCWFLWMMPEHTGGHRRIIRLKTFHKMLDGGLIEEHHREIVGNLLDSRHILRFFHIVDTTDETGDTAEG